VQADLWYLVYTDEFGTTHTVKGAMQSIRRCLKEGRLGDAGNIRISKQPGGPFESLRTHPEFRDLVIVPASVPLLTPLSGTEVPRADTNGPGSGGLGRPKTPQRPESNSPRPLQTPHSGVIIKTGVSQDSGSFNVPAAYQLNKPKLAGGKRRNDTSLMVFLGLVMLVTTFLITFAILYFWRRFNL
jgi:hypothetical protein